MIMSRHYSVWENNYEKQSSLFKQLQRERKGIYSLNNIRL